MNALCTTERWMICRIGQQQAAAVSAAAAAVDGLDEQLMGPERIVCNYITPKSRCTEWISGVMFYVSHKTNITLFC